MAKSKTDKKTLDAFERATSLRAKAYAYIYEELEKEAGEELADRVFIKAIYRLGVDKSKTYSAKAKKSAKEFAEEFVADPVGSSLFKQKILSSSTDNAKIQMEYCPLVKMWKDMGLSKSKISKLCDLAYQVDFGTVEGLGYKLKFDCRIADNKKSCILDVSKN
jgi:hypothetical protein